MLAQEFIFYYSRLFDRLQLFSKLKPISLNDFSIIGCESITIKPMTVAKVRFF